MDCDVLGTMGMSARPLDRFWVSAWDACLKKVSVCFSLWADSTKGRNLEAHTIPRHIYLISSLSAQTPPAWLEPMSTSEVC